MTVQTNTKTVSKEERIANFQKRLADAGAFEIPAVVLKVNKGEYTNQHGETGTYVRYFVKYVMDDAAHGIKRGAKEDVTRFFKKGSKKNVIARYANVKPGSGISLHLFAENHQVHSFRPAKFNPAHRANK